MESRKKECSRRSRILLNFKFRRTIVERKSMTGCGLISDARAEGRSSRQSFGQIASPFDSSNFAD